MAALPKRMRVAQEAFTRWYLMVIKATSALAEQKSFEEERKWWRENCLYLDSDAREVFWDSIIAAEGYGPIAIRANFTRLSTTYTQRVEEEKAREECEKLRQQLLKFGRTIQAIVDVPSWNEERIINPIVEHKPIVENKTTND